VQPISAALVAFAVVAFALFSSRAERSPLTPPMFFVAVGFALRDLVEVDTGIIDYLAELTLVLVLFVDASRIDLGILRREGNLPARMLAIGMPLTIALGAVCAMVCFPAMGWPVAFLLASILAPTDAALGQPVVSNPGVPVRIRQTLNVESGLNDGIALPFVLIFASVSGAHEASGDTAHWVRFAVLAVTLGPLVGGAVGLLGATLLRAGTNRRWINAPFQRLCGLALAVLAFSGAELVGGNGFIAAFVAGAVLGNAAREACTGLYRFGEAEGQLLTLLVFVAFGATMVPAALPHVTRTVVLYSLLSLTVVRMLPVAVSLLGCGLAWPTVGFLGWFGPRGLASILFVLLVAEQGRLETAPMLEAIVVLTVLGSTLLHGITAYPLAMVYGRWVRGLAEEMPEHHPVEQMPLRNDARPWAAADADLR
jgi:NhaP-type Na+/H+ or K+/H+ antiporter